MDTHVAQPALPQAVRDAAAQRAQRAAVARALEGRAPRQAAGLDWQALDDAPPWIALDDNSLRLLRRRVGSVLLAPALRLWISAAKVNAARATLGDDWWRRLLEHQPWPDWSSELAQWGDWPADAPSTPEAVAAVLDEAGGAVMLGTVPHGALRHAVSQALAALAALESAATPLESATATSLESTAARFESTAARFESAATPLESITLAMPQARAQAVLALTFALLRDEATAALNVAASEASTPSSEPVRSAAPEGVPQAPAESPR
jgi:hypothetical protein